MNAQWQNPRGIQERIIVTGTLVLETPTHLGNGDAEGPLDMPLLLDPLEGRALLTGTSIAGALRNYLREYSIAQADLLFGKVTEEESFQSPLIVDDALGNEPEVELRDGVAIDPKTRTAEARKKFDIELLIAGTEFPLSFELLILKEKQDELREAFVLALQGLERGEICLGKRKRRGFGRCRVTQWTVCRYNMTNPHGLISWLKGDQADQKRGNDIATLLDLTVKGITRQPVCILEGSFLLDSSLLIRSGSGEADAPDIVHLHSKRHGQEVPILSGTSLAGALRGRSLRIAKTIGLKKAEAFVDKLFGQPLSPPGTKTEHKEKPCASRLWVEETIVQKPLEMVQTRVKIDRFTGGSYPGALFSEQPVFGQKDTRVQIHLRLLNPKKKEVGLLLLLLKDLWTGDLPLGGEGSVGRGRLKGERAILVHANTSWTFTQQEDGTIYVEGGEKARLEQFVQAFVEAREDETRN